MINFSMLKELSRLKKYPQGTIIASDGEAADLVVVLKGEVGVFANFGKPNAKLLSKVGAGDFFGETALLLEKSPPFTFLTLEDVIALPLGRKTAVSFIRHDPDMGFEIMKALCARLDAISSDYEALAGHPWQPAEPSAPQQAAEPAAAELPKAAKPAPAPVPAPPARTPVHAPSPALQSTATGAGFSLFPPEHGVYRLPLENEDPMRLMDRSYTCPICKKEFKKRAVRSSKLIEEGTDSDMRHRYRGVEPLYYDVVTCPHCLFSALADMFASPDFPRADQAELKALLPETEGIFGTHDAVSVFASYYLALLCAPKYFAGHNLATAKLLLKLMRVYQDCGDAGMEQAVAQRALDAYMNVYINEQSDAGQDQQICIILGELYLKLNDLKNAREFFFKAKTNRAGAPILKNHAETRISDIRVLENQVPA